ncbi:MAG: RagB/SusD family nutrient uptake outer membrane protein, partial [Muribaculaceae bacterium]|nr:RagB/SusD family nutrient uptake outer membrane protein [Muribaculaceae bacterium]
MKTNIILATAAAFCGITLASCSDALELYPVDSVSDENFWNSEKDLELYANGFYGILPGALGPGADDQSDCFVNEKPNTWIFNLETKPSSGGGWSSGDWGNIRSCNYFLSRYHRATGGEAQINRQVAVVRFFRAWEYFYKLRRFGDVPWYETDLNVDSEELYNGRDNRKTVFKNMLRDMDFAIEWLQDAGSVPAGRLHKDAARAFKVRACLYEASFRKYHGLGDHTELYRMAAETAMEIISQGRYDIWSNGKPESDYYNLFIQEDLSNNPECIMPRVYETKLLMHNNTRQLEESYTGMSRAMFEQYLCADGKPTGASPTYGAEAQMLADEIMRRDPRLAQSIDNPTL